MLDTFKRLSYTLYLMKVLAIALLAPLGALAQYGPDPDGVPADFLCGWRKLALSYSSALRPDAAGLVHDALELHKYCNGTVPRPDDASLPAVFPPRFASPPAAGLAAIVVDGAKGSDSNPGTVAAPLKTIAAGVAKARAQPGAASTVELRGGTYYMATTLLLTEADSGLTLQNYGGEEVWLTGASPLGSLRWQPWLSRNASVSALAGQNNAEAGGACSSTVPGSSHKMPNPPGSPNCGCRVEASASACGSSCLAATNCTSYTFHDASLGAPWTSMCCLRTDGVWAPVKEAGHTSGARTAAINGWKASTGDALSRDAIVTELRLNGERLNAARFPNADPETQFWPTGYLTSKGGFMPKGDWLEPTIAPQPNTAVPVLVNDSDKSRDWDDYFAHYAGGINGTCAIYDPPFSYWCQSPPFSKGCGGCFTWNIPSGMRFAPEALPRAPSYTNVADAQFFAWRAAHWANWMFDVASIEGSTIRVGRGGFQGARGGAGSDWFIANLLEELDDPREFYYDRREAMLYVIANSTDGAPPAADAVYEGLQQETLVRVEGSAMDKPVTGLTLRGLGFRDTAPTYMEPHGVPSGGDWALERYGALFLHNTEGATVDKCKVWRASGNGIMLSAYNDHPTISNSEFAWMGGSAIAAWGFTDELSDGGVHGVDGTGGDFPRHTLVEGNLFHEIGVWEKQSSAFFQAKTAQTTLRRNVVFNLARAGFNFNDGFGGGDNVTGNVLFNTCRESSDHGPINSWDRQPFLTTVRTGEPSMQMEWREVWGNFIVANYGGTKQVDNDDGSLFWRVHDNYMQYGWCAKFKCGGIESFGNLKAFVDLGGRFDAGCTTHAGLEFYPNLWHNDTMIHLGASDFSYHQGWDNAEGKWGATQIYDNTIYLEKGYNAMIDNETLAQAQAKGDDPGTRQINSIPASADILADVQSLLKPYFAPS